MERLARGDEEPVAAAEAALRLGVRVALFCLYRWSSDMVRLVASGSEAPALNLDMAGRRQALARGVDLKALFDQLDLVTRALQLADRQLTPQLLLEDPLLAWRGAFAPRAR